MSSKDELNPCPGMILTPPPTRVAVLDGESFTVHDVLADDFPSFRDKVAETVFPSLEGTFPRLPEITLRELLDNLVHAVPCSASVVVDSSLKRLYICDTGPGIGRLDLAMEPGYSTATEVHRSIIRGVGLGFYLVEREVRELGGELQVFSHPGEGTYVAVSLLGGDLLREDAELVNGLSHRQNNILFLLTEEGYVGPSRVAQELGISLSTSYRELVRLEKMGIVGRSPDGKRFLSEMGKSYLQSILSP